MPRSFRQRRVAHSLSLACVAIVLACGGTGFTSLLTGVRSPPPPSSSLRLSPSHQFKIARQASGAASESIAVKKGDRVQVFYENVWYDCEVLDVDNDGKTCTARYDDGGDEEGDIDVAERVRAMPPPMKLEKGKRVEVEFEGQWYDCEILAVSEDGETCTAKYDDGEEEESDIAVRQRVREPRIKFDDLEVGQKFAGKVTSIAPFGAFVDIGAERDGLVHISRIADERIEDIYEYVSEGQEVDVWVSQVTEDGKLGLAMLESKVGGAQRRGPQDFSAFVDVPSDQWLTGTVARIAPFGFFVTVAPPEGGDAADGLVHITQIRDGFVENTEDEAEVGQEIKVRVQSVDLDQGRMSLSMKEPGSGGGGSRAPADLTPFADAHPDEWLSGEVARTAPFGAFVTVTSADGKSTADGLVHITQIRDGFVESVEDELEAGQEVKVRVLSVDTGAGKMSLSMKEADGY